MPTGTDVILQAKKYIGVKYHHQGRNRQHGLDCVGILVVTAEDLGMFVAEKAVKYKLRAVEGTLREALLENGCEEISMEEVTDGDILTFWYEKRDVEYHAALVEIKPTYWNLIHCSGASPRKNKRGRSSAHLGKVTEHPMDDFWKKRVMGAYRHKDVETK